MFNIMLIGNGFDLQHGISIKFKDFVSSNIFKEFIGKRYLNFFDDINYKNFSNSTELWNNFEDYLKHICIHNKINEKYFIKRITILFQKWISKKEIQLPKRDSFIKRIIYENKIDFLISLNYTSTPKIYGFSKKIFKIDSIKSEWTDFESMKQKFINLHSYNDKTRKIHFIIGNDSHDSISKNKFIEEWSEKNKFNPKELLLRNILKTNLISKIFVYGYSFGNSDKNLNTFLYEFSSNRKVYVFCKTNDEIKLLNIRDFLFKK